MTGFGTIVSTPTTASSFSGKAAWSAAPAASFAIKRQSRGIFRGGVSVSVCDTAEGRKCCECRYLRQNHS